MPVIGDVGLLLTQYAFPPTMFEQWDIPPMLRVTSVKAGWCDLLYNSYQKGACTEAEEL